MALELTEGWTERISYQLGADGSAPNLTGMIVTLVLYRNGDYTIFPFLGTSGILTAATGIVYFDPAETDLVAANSPYSGRWKVTDGAGKISYFPNGTPEQWIVRKP